MKIFAIVLLLTSSLTAAPRMSADGEPFPDAAAPAFRGQLPLIRDKLGGLPEDMGSRVFNAKKSAAILAKNLYGPTDFQWFVLGFSGSDVTGFDLTDGRISRIVWRKNHPATLVINDVKAKVPKEAANQLGAAMSVIIRTGDVGIEFTANPVDWYILHHSPEKAIGEAMKGRVPVKTMTPEQATIVFGKPVESNSEDGITAITWEERKPIRRKVTIGSSDDAYRAMLAAINAPTETRVVRIVKIRFDHGVAVSFTDDHVE